MKKNLRNFNKYKKLLKTNALFILSTAFFSQAVLAEKEIAFGNCPELNDKATDPPTSIEMKANTGETLTFENSQTITLPKKYTIPFYALMEGRNSVVCSYMLTYTNEDTKEIKDLIQYSYNRHHKDNTYNKFIVKEGKEKMWNGRCSDVNRENCFLYGVKEVKE